MEPIPFIASVGGHRYDTSASALLADDAFWDGHSFERGGRNCFLFRTQLRGLYFALRRSTRAGEDDFVEPLTREEALKLWQVLPRRNAAFEEAFPSAAGASSQLKPLKLGRDAGTKAVPAGAPDTASIEETTVPQALDQPRAEYLGESATQPPEGPHKPPLVPRGASLDVAGDDPGLIPVADPGPQGTAEERSVSNLRDLNEEDPAAVDGSGISSAASAPAGPPTGDSLGAGGRADEEKDVPKAVEAAADHRSSARLELEAPSHEGPRSMVESSRSARGRGEPRVAHPRGTTDGSTTDRPVPTKDGPSASSAPDIWLDARGEWQTEGVVRHQSGRMRLQHHQLVVTQSGLTGRFRKVPWTRSDIIDVVSLRAVTVHRPVDALSRVVLVARDGTTTTLLECRPRATLLGVLQQLRRLNSELDLTIEE